jgi:transcription initiation factor TFIID subunit 6
LGTEIVRVVIVGNLKTWYQGVISKMKETSDIEKKMLDKAIVEALRSLKFAPSIQVDQQSSADKLTELVGSEVSQMIMGLPDGQEIANGVLLGEFKE